MFIIAHTFRSFLYETVGDFCWTFCMAPEFLKRIAYEGFIPIGDCIAGHTNRRPKPTGSRHRLPPSPSVKTPFPPSSSSSSSVDDEHNVPQQRDTEMTVQSPGGNRIIILLPKLNRRRCIVTPNEIHVPRNARKRSRRFVMTVNQCFDAVNGKKGGKRER